MLSIPEVDAHVHTINSFHAYSTIGECTMEAYKKGLKCIVITDHFGPEFLCGTLFQLYASITNKAHLPDEINGIRIINGAEVDIVDENGNLAFHNCFFPFDSEISILNKLFDKCKVIMASYHNFIKGINYSKYTEMLASCIMNPNVNILGHCDRMDTLFDIDYITSLAKKEHKIIELNTKSLKSTEASRERFLTLIKKCRDNEVMVSLGSDAHNAYEIGDFDEIQQVFRELDFPQKQIISNNMDNFIKFINMQNQKRYDI